jgi:hypothetical protein
MHQGHDHHHHDHGSGGHAHAHAHSHAGHGHNGSGARQWQTPHLPAGVPLPETAPAEPDLDLVETAFVDAFPKAPDPTSFLRLAGVPFVGQRGDGATLSLLRVEVNHTTDIGVLTPHLGGGSHRYDPLPGKMAEQRQKLALVYFDGTGIVPLSLAEAKALKDVTPGR